MLKYILLLAGCAMAQVYDNPALSAHYEVPAGWAMDKIDTGFFGVHFQATRVGLKPVDIYFEKYDNTIEAYMEPGSYGFYLMADFYKRCSASTVAPIAPYLNDTTFNSGMTIYGFNMRHVALDMHLVCYMASSKNFVEKFCYETTMSDFDTNHDLYSKNWLNMSFNSTPPTAAKIATSDANQIEARKYIINALGRKAEGAAPKTPSYYIPKR